MFDYHMHSTFSADCEEPMEKTIESAIKKGLTEICFTEHVDYDYPDPTISFDLDYQAYDRKIKEMQQKYADSIGIKKGVEVGIEPCYVGRFGKMLDEETFDFIICSMHVSERKDLHSGDFFKGKTVDEAYEIYYRELLDCVRRFDRFSILGHVDLVKRYTKEKAKNNFHELIGEIFNVIIPRGQGIELNTSGYRYGLGGGMPSTDILRLYKECGGEVLTLGSDSHVAETVAYKFKESLKLFQDIGFKYVTTFNDMKPTFHPISKLI
ncbi:histidinol-phosphatase HisJ family protein [Aciduricibacillus chroicocephali]|uniref:Histidinol-phosphatase n=1 Tax=Aciduricibacillus chroicocephali TaxID=3054939 RepID=A0ABY9KWV4_9BACI|nr:histidinol-phosphatase HisJ family protein [Bacillaceae bacterium 44XB]